MRVTFKRVKLGVALSLAAAGAAVLAAPASAASYPLGSGASPITQKYLCTTPVGDISEKIQVAGDAAGSHGALSLKHVTFSFVNNFGTDVTIDKIRFIVPDPDPDSAPYQAGSAAVSATPRGWTAGHKSGGIYEYFAGTQDLGDGATLEVPLLSATYQNLGPKGTLIEWKPGPFSFDVKSPDPGTIACTPKQPAKTFASYLE